ncbi:hypothetical protein CDL15_Pgr019439 [Punica granatum]|nr:hypothetical protein CDL15_Pgr019439 [Punica granatum]
MTIISKKVGRGCSGIIKSENPNLNTVTVKEDRPATRDYRAHRVRVVVNDSDIFTEVPTVG